jgi:hypothetical protein
MSPDELAALQYGQVVSVTHKNGSVTFSRVAGHTVSNNIPCVVLEIMDTSLVPYDTSAGDRFSLVEGVEG